MPRTIPTPLLTHLQGRVLTTALLFTITRTDSVVIGLTTCNVDLTLSTTGQVYRALDSAAASQLRQTASTGVDNVTVAGVLTSSYITDGDLLAGRYDGASIEIDVCNYTEHPLVNTAILVTGTLGEVTFADGQYTAEFRSLSQRLQQKIGALTSATCRVKQLFDSQCFVGGHNYPNTHVATDFQYNNVPVVTVQDQQNIVFNNSAGNTVFDQGRAQFTTGANAGLQLEVKKSVLLVTNNMLLTFMTPWVFPVNVGDQAFLEQGCDRTVQVCSNRFNNVGNIRCEPYLPANTRVIHWGRR